MKKISLLLFISLLIVSPLFWAIDSFAKPATLNPTPAESNDFFLVNKNPSVQARLIANTKAIVPGQPFQLGVELTMKPGWHTYYKEPGDAGMPTKIIWQLPPGFSNSDLYWQKPTKLVEEGITTYGYTGKTIITTKVTPSLTLNPSETVGFLAQVKWLSCKDICVPGQSTVQLDLPIVTQSNRTDLSINTKEFASANISSTSSSPPILSGLANVDPGPSHQSDYITYFILAIIGGFLLNFMPCVLPVVAIKILSLLEQKNKDSTRKTVIAFSSGILSSFILLGLLVISLQAAGHQIGWGFQFQQPIFLMLMSTVVLLFALSLLGLFNFSLNYGQQTVDGLATKEGFIGDFFKGVLATILSTPCTAPFLGTALGFAFVQPWSVTLSIFTAVGIGMCLPYLILVIAPQYLRFLPKPGDWMSKLKEAFGFVLLATVVWLLSILYFQIPVTAVIDFMYFLLAIAFAVWLLNSFTDLCSTEKRLLLFRSLSLVIVIVAAYAFIFKNKDILLGAANNNISQSVMSSGQSLDNNPDKPFDPTALNTALASGKTVFLDFTAKWCLTCQLNEGAVIDTKEIQNKFHSLNVVFLKADWTKQDPTVTTLLRKFERSGVPFYIIFPGNNPDKPIFLPEILTKEIVLSKLDEAGPSINKN